ncbi:hypothetical protein [Nostoc sp.]
MSNKILVETAIYRVPKIEVQATDQGAWYENLTFFVTGRKL